MDMRKLDFWKRFSIVVFLYFSFIFIVWFVPEWDLIGKISWTFFLLMLLHFSYATLDLVERIEMWLEGNRGYVIERSKVDLTVMYEVKKVMRFMWKRICGMELWKRMKMNVKSLELFFRKIMKMIEKIAQFLWDFAFNFIIVDGEMY